MMISYPKKLEKIFSELHKHSIKPIIVGGYVRDTFLNRSSKDIDIELYNIDSLQKVSKILEKFGSVNSVGKSFGVLKLNYEDLELDFSLPRLDSKVEEGHKGFKITINTSLTFKEAASRRDFTINAIGYDVISKTVLDPYNGINDLKEKILRAVDLQKFGEDPLRVLRGVGFATRFCLQMQKDLFDHSKAMIKQGVLQELPKERIFEEIKKILLRSQKPSKAFYLLRDLLAFEYFFDEFQKLSTEDLSTVLTRVDRSLKIFKNETKKEKIIIMLALLSSKFSLHDQEKFLEKLTNEKELLKSITIFTQIQFDLFNLTDYAIYKLATKVEIALYIPYLLASHPTQKEAIEELEQRAKDLNVFHKPLTPLIKGRDLIASGLKPSQEFSKILDELYEDQMKGLFSTKEEALQLLPILSQNMHLIF